MRATTGEKIPTCIYIYIYIHIYIYIYILYIYVYIYIYTYNMKLYKGCYEGSIAAFLLPASTIHQAESSPTASSA